MNLKHSFSTAPILAMWQENRDTVLETDASGWATGGCLSQFDENGCLHPVAYHSKKLTPTECNYDIHDKELLAIIRCLNEWRGELVGLLKPFTILTDHKNLKYFMTTRNLTERQIRWSQLMAEFNFSIHFRAGKKAERPDALSRRVQDVPKRDDDPRLKERESQLLKDEWLGIKPTNSNLVAVTSIEKATIPKGPALFEDPELQSLWDKGVQNDQKNFLHIYNALHKGLACFPPQLKLKAPIGECIVDSRGALCFRNRLWIPEWEPLRTALIQRTHDSHMTGHPGRDNTFAILARQFYWPGMSLMVRKFCRNCDVCGRAHVWRSRRQGLLLPMPIPERFHSELSIDFMTDLPAKKGDPSYLMVITDRLLKSITLEAMSSMKAEDCAERFLYCHYRFHGFPSAITSDRGSNWVGDFWRHLCKMAGVEQRLSTAFHPQTDGATERANQEVLSYLRCFLSFAQYEWVSLLPTAQLSINNRDTSGV